MRADLLGAQTTGARPGPARGTCGALCARRHRLHQGRSRPCRPGVFAVRGPLRGGRQDASRGRAVARETGRHTRYVPSLTGDLDALRAQIAAAKNDGIDTVMIQPMIMGFSNAATLKRENPDIAFFAHPTLAGAARIAPALLFGK